MDDILGPIPKQEELMSEIRSIEDEIKAETDESAAMAIGGKTKSPPMATLPDADQFAPPPPPGPASEHTGSAPPDPGRATSSDRPDPAPRKPARPTT